MRENLNTIRGIVIWILGACRRSEKLCG